MLYLHSPTISFENFGMAHAYTTLALVLAQNSLCEQSEQDNFEIADGHISLALLADHALSHALISSCDL